MFATLASVLAGFVFIPVAAFTAPTVYPSNAEELAWERTDPIPTTPCENEDGPGPCFWDATTAGNGIGTSFWIDCAQSFHYFDPAVDEMYGGPGDAYPNNC